jgi:hypothetical protein
VSKEDFIYYLDEFATYSEDYFKLAVHGVREQRTVDNPDVLHVLRAQLEELEAAITELLIGKKTAEIELWLRTRKSSKQEIVACISAITTAIKNNSIQNAHAQIERLTKITE